MEEWAILVLALIVVTILATFFAGDVVFLALSWVVVIVVWSVWHYRDTPEETTHKAKVAVYCGQVNTKQENWYERTNSRANASV